MEGSAQTYLIFAYSIFHQWLRLPQWPLQTFDSYTQYMMVKRENTVQWT